MAEVIRKGAATDDVLSDVEKTLRNARARGGTWQSAAEEKLGTVERLAALVTTRLNAAEHEYEPLKAALDAEDDVADDFLGGVSDDIWNKVGRPGSDPVLSIMFPTGISYYTDGSDEEQPERMDLLAELLGQGLHPRLDAATSATHAASVRSAAERYRHKVDALRGPAARVRLLSAMKTAIGRYAQTELANLKRRYKSDSHSEADIHTVIPAHTRAAPKADAEPTPPAPVPVTNPVTPR